MWYFAFSFSYIKIELIYSLFKGKLDCLRKSVTPNEVDESEEQRKRRIDAEWNSDCSFEAQNTGKNKIHR